MRIYSGIKYLYKSSISFILIYNYVEHLKYNNMRFKEFMTIYYFMQVQESKMRLQNKIEHFSL
jgi:hypothetical protein